MPSSFSGATLHIFRGMAKTPWEDTPMQHSQTARTLADPLQATFSASDLERSVGLRSGNPPFRLQLRNPSTRDNSMPHWRPCTSVTWPKISGQRSFRVLFPSLSRQTITVPLDLQRTTWVTLER